MTDSVRAIIEEVDKFNDNHQDKQAYDRLKKAIDGGMKETELYWRLARACRGMALLPETKDLQERKNYFEEGMSAAKAGMAINDNDPKCNSWYAICLNYRSKSDGVDQRIKNSYIMRDHWLKALRVEPTDFATLHSMGVWCYTVTSLPWIKRQFAKTFFTTPPESTYEESLRYLLESEKYSPQFYADNAFHIAKCYAALKQNEEAKTYYQKVLDCQDTDQETMEAKKEAEVLIKKL
ncbi:Regulator of microtubule dynamics protein 1 [Clonorchis sinensis]|uniref:Regulator of microtubule dynamics protein 1 n=2 Tax=Clonorchis sinensis TaxID=79923 RepID=A0A8T1MWH2_CLOSI|nr:Regulator of microtubule dynamics protein 1 [Clonorchis sinensis]